VVKESLLSNLQFFIGVSKSIECWYFLKMKFEKQHHSYELNFETVYLKKIVALFILDSRGKIMRGENIMKVTVIGANGNIGRLATEKLQKKGHTPVAMVRKESQKPFFKDKGIDTIFGDLSDSIENLTKVVEGSDAVVFTAGSGGSTGAEQTMMIDLDGAVKAIEASKNAAIPHFIMVSAIGSDRWLTDHPEFLDQLGAYYPAKFYADEWLINSGLHYTILRPGALTDDPETGKISTGNHLDPSPISRSDVAEVIVAMVEDSSKKDKAFDFVGGQDLISNALAKEIN